MCTCSLLTPCWLYPCIVIHASCTWFLTLRVITLRHNTRTENEFPRSTRKSTRILQPRLHIYSAHNSGKKTLPLIRHKCHDQPQLIMALIAGSGWLARGGLSGWNALSEIALLDSCQNPIVDLTFYPADTLASQRDGFRKRALPDVLIDG